MGVNYVRVVNDEVKYVGPLPKGFKNISRFDLITDLAVLKSHGWLPLEEISAVYDNKTHYRKSPLIDIQADKVVYSDNIVPFTAEQIKQNTFNDWLGEMAAHDSPLNGQGIVRATEDVLEILSDKFPNILDSIPALKAKYDAKKAARAAQPPAPL